MNEQFGRGLRTIGFVHGDFRDERRRRLALRDVAVNLSGFSDGPQILGSRGECGGGIERQRLGEARDFNAAAQLGMTPQKIFGGLLFDRTADGVGDIDGEEVAGRQEAIDGIEIDVVSVHIIRVCPAERAHGGIGGRASAGWFRAHGLVLTVGFVPDRNDGDALFGGAHAGGQLGLPLVRKTVSDA